MGKSKIEWTDTTWNPITGCSKVSEGCRNCYAESYANRFWGDRKFTDVQCHEDRLDQPLRWKKPRRVFVNSMSDLFHPDVPDEFIDAVFGRISACPHHTFQILTKRPERMQKFMSNLDESFTGEFYKAFPNVWLGVSAEDQKTADERIPILLKTPAAVRFVSYEPALGPVDFMKKRCLHHDREFFASNEEHEFCQLCVDNGFTLTSGNKLWMGDEMISGIDWIIMGGESGPNARPMHPDWARSVRDQCQEANVAFFMKQMSKKAQIPDDLFIREFPNATR